MEEVTVEDEKKPFDADGAAEEETQPDPDEQLMLDQGNGRVWLVKIPKHLMERWSKIDTDDVHLATIRVYHNATGRSGKKPRIVLFLPPPSGQSSAAQDPLRPSFPADTPVSAPLPTDPDSYELDMVNDAVENQIVVAERPKVPPSATAHQQPGYNPRARTTILTGRIKHDCNLRPMFSESYRKQMKERSRKYNTPQRQIRMIEDAGVPGGRGGVNRLSSGVGVGSSSAFSDLIKNRPKPVKGAFERMARMPRNQLLDLLFSLFREGERWSLRLLREKTQQPEIYLKEVLAEIAILHRSGEFNGMWELKPHFKEEGIKGEAVAGPSMGGSPSDVKMEGLDEGGEDEDDDDDDEDDDMEEVS